MIYCINLYLLHDWGKLIPQHNILFLSSLFSVSPLILPYALDLCHVEGVGIDELQYLIPDDTSFTSPLPSSQLTLNTTLHTPSIPSQTTPPAPERLTRIKPGRVNEFLLYEDLMYKMSNTILPKTNPTMRNYVCTFWSTASLYSNDVRCLSQDLNDDEKDQITSAGKGVAYVCSLSKLEGIEAFVLGVSESALRPDPSYFYPPVTVPSIFPTIFASPLLSSRIILSYL